MSRPLIVAHRGASAFAPENTIASFRQSISYGSEGVEFDVRLTRDGVPVVFHDATLKRIAGIDKRVADLNFEELADIDVGSWFDRANPKLADAENSKQRIPTLAAVLELFENENGPVYIELKCDRRSDAEPLVDAVQEIIAGSKTERERIIVKSFELSTLPLVRRLIPEVATAALFAPKFVRFIPGRPSLVETARKFEATHLSLHRSLVNNRLMKQASGAGMPVTAWTVDSPAWIAHRMDLGLFAVITNDPARLLAVV